MNTPRLLEVLALANVARQWDAGARPAVLHPGDTGIVRESLVELGLLLPVARGAGEGTIHARPTPVGLSLGRAAAAQLDAGAQLPLGLTVEAIRALAHLRRQELSGVTGGRREGSPCERARTASEADWCLLRGHALAALAGPRAARLTASGRRLADAVLPERSEDRLPDPVPERATIVRLDRRMLP